MGVPERLSREEVCRAQEQAVDIDLRCALAFSRSALRAMAALSEEAGAVVDECLAEELRDLTPEYDAHAQVVGAILEEFRTLLTGRAADLKRKRLVEDQLVGAAMAVAGAAQPSEA